MTWSLSGKYPTILRHEVVGEEAQRLFDDANVLFIAEAAIFSVAYFGRSLSNPLKIDGCQFFILPLFRM
jgi:hypothetical protein